MLKNYPLELILRPEGTAELVDANDRTLWASDADEDFHEEDFDDFLTDDDLDDILDYLVDAEVLTDQEAEAFEDGRYECTVESLPDAVGDDVDLTPEQVLNGVTHS